MCQFRFAKISNGTGITIAKKTTDTKSSKDTEQQTDCFGGRKQQNAHR